MRASFLKRAIKRYYKNLGYEVNFPRGGLKVGNAMIDGEAIKGPIRLGVELKSDTDCILRGEGQLLEALSHGYDMALLVTSTARAERLNLKVFQATRIGLASINSKGEVRFLVEPKSVKF